MHPSPSTTVHPRTSTVPFVILAGANPDFLPGLKLTAASAAFKKESGMMFADTTEMHRKSGEAT